MMPIRKSSYKPSYQDTLHCDENKGLLEKEMPKGYS